MTEATPTTTAEESAPVEPQEPTEAPTEAPEETPGPRRRNRIRPQRRDRAGRQPRPSLFEKLQSQSGSA